MNNQEFTANWADSGESATGKVNVASQRDELSALRAERDELKRALEFAADAYDDELATGSLADKLYDVGCIARAALARCEKGER